MTSNSSYFSKRFTICSHNASTGIVTQGSPFAITQFVQNEKKKVESFSSAIKSGLIDFSVPARSRRVALRRDAKSDVTERQKKDSEKKKEERTIALVRAADVCRSANRVKINFQMSHRASENITARETRFISRSTRNRKTFHTFPEMGFKSP